jgi:hypothetical protein
VIVIENFGILLERRDRGFHGCERGNGHSMDAELVHASDDSPVAIGNHRITARSRRLGSEPHKHFVGDVGGLKYWRLTAGVGERSAHTNKYGENQSAQSMRHGTLVPSGKFSFELLGFITYAGG